MRSFAKKGVQVWGLMWVLFFTVSIFVAFTPKFVAASVEVGGPQPGKVFFTWEQIGPCEVEFHGWAIGEIVWHYWFFDDGQIELVQGSPGTITHTYPENNCRTRFVELVGFDGFNSTDWVDYDYVYLECDTSPPDASFAFSPNNPVISQIITFDATMSYDSCGIANYYWDFGDGNSTEGEVVTHVYNKSGDYTVALQVTDTSGNSDVAKKNINITKAFTTGTIKFDEEEYTNIYDRVVVMVVDPDRNKDESIEDIVEITVRSYDTIYGWDTGLINLNLSETTCDSGIFTGFFIFSPFAGTTGIELNVSQIHPGVLHAIYIDEMDAEGNANRIRNASANYRFYGTLKGRVWMVLFFAREVISITPVENADVWAIPKGATIAIAHTETNEVGGFTLDYLKPGTYEVRVSYHEPGVYYRKEYSQEVEVRAANVTWVEFPEQILEIMKRAYKDAAHADYIRLETSYINQARFWRIVDCSITVFFIPYLYKKAAEAVAKDIITKFMLEKAIEEGGKWLVLKLWPEYYEREAKKVIDQLEKIANDPPDYNYTEIFKPEIPAPITLPEDYDGFLNDSIINLTNTLAYRNAIDGALLISFERYQGALEVGDVRFMIVQLEAMIYYVDLINDNQDELNQAITLLISEIESIRDDYESSFQELQVNLSQEGFTPEEEQKLRDMGLSDSDLENYKELLLACNFSDVLKGLEDLQASTQSRADAASNLSNQSSEVLSFLTQISGCYLGAYLGCGSDDLSCESIQEFNQKMGKNHAIFVRFISTQDSRNPAHWEWADAVKVGGAMPLFVYDPWDGLAALNMSDVEYFASRCNEFNQTVFVVFGHEMNGPWYAWGNDPENYTSMFKEVAEIFHHVAPNVVMCWVPNQNWGYPWGGTDYGNGYSEYYPSGIGTYGDYVDWVGLNFYEKDWDEDNFIPPDMFVANIKNGQDSADFYAMFAIGKNKPMLIVETGAFDPNKDPTSPGLRNPLNDTEQTVFKNEWIGQVYNASTLEDEFPRLNAICYFHVNKTEIVDTQTHSFYCIAADYKLPEQTNVYQELISNNYFIGGEKVVVPFDTGAPATPYPSMSGIHNGTITPLVNLTVSELYTYPCPGTGGHTEYVKIWKESEVLAEKTWNGYTGDWHNLSFNNSFTLYANQTYNYTIRTGSYPQIIHQSPFNATGGKITCEEFVEKNGKRHEGWIPAIKLS